MKPTNRGFTLVELMVTLVIVGVLAAIAVPTFRSIGYTSKRSSMVNELISSLQFARGEAIKRGVQTVVCAGKDQCGDDDDWVSGWLVFVNTDNDIPAQLDTGELVLRRGRASPDQLEMVANVSDFVFKPFNTRMVGGAITVCTPAGSNEARAVIVSTTGRSRASKEDASGNPLECPS